jgi:hypothetical protein
MDELEHTIVIVGAGPTGLCQRRGTPSCLLGQLRPVLDMFQFGVRTGSFNTMFILRWE